MDCCQGNSKDLETIARTAFAPLLCLSLGVWDCGADKDDDRFNSPDPCWNEGRYDDGHCDRDCMHYDGDCDGMGPGPGMCDPSALAGDAYCNSSCAEVDPDCGGGKGPDECFDEHLYGNGSCDDQCPSPDPDCFGVPPDHPCITERRYGDGTCDPDCPAGDIDCDREGQNTTQDPCELHNGYNDADCDGCFYFDSACSGIDPEECAENGLYGNGVCDACGAFDPDCAPYPPGRPEHFEATEGIFPDRVVLTWGAATTRDTISYKVYRAESPAQTGTLIGEVWSRAVRGSADIVPGLDRLVLLREDYADTTVTPGTLYFYRVAAVGSKGVSQKSELRSGFAGVEADAEVPHPRGLSVEATSSKTIYIRWENVSTAWVYYALPISQYQGGLAQRRAHYSGDIRSGLQAELPFPGQAFFLSVAAWKRSDTSSDLIPSMLAPPVRVVLDREPTLPAPQNVTASTGLPGKVRVEWDAVAGAHWYKLYVEGPTPQGGSVPWMIPSGSAVPTLYAEHQELDESVKAYYVRAFDDAEESSDFSAPAHGNPSQTPPPENVSATPDGVAAIVLTWDPSPGVSSYAVARSTEANMSNATYFSDIEATSYRDEDIQIFVQYYYQVFPIIGNQGTGNGSAIVPAIITPNVLPPQNVAATDSDPDVVTVSWQAVTDATYYHVFRSESSTGPFTQLSSTNVTGLSYTDVIPLADLSTVYYYRVRAYDGTHESPDSTTDSGRAVRLAQPQGVTATGPGQTTGDKALNTTVKIEWQSVTKAHSYRIYRSNSKEGQATRVGEVFSPSVQFTDASATGLELAFIYYYQVVASSTRGTESPMPQEKASGGTSLPYAEMNGLSFLAGPQNVTASDGTYSDKIRVSWNAAPGASQYKVFRAAKVQACEFDFNTCPQPFGTFYDAGITSELFLNDAPETPTSDPKSGQRYYYMVRPMRSDGLESMHDYLLPDAETGYRGP